ncbi:MAG: pirin family protein [Rhodospirillaceae bacterium]|nr:pirin family protein [Rhodospirillaceae bacterium]
MEMVIPARRRSLGGFKVGRVLPFAKRRMVGPFVFLDHMGPVDLPADIPQSTDVRPHPHIGLSTVTYLFNGEITHRDSLGVAQVIRPGELNWMTAGRGISHSERFDGMRRDGGRVDGIQAWVALPEAQEESAPDFKHYGAAELPLIEDTGFKARLIAGSAFGATSPAKIASPLFYLDVVLSAGGNAPLPAGYPERAAYVASGRVNVDGHDYEAGQMLVFAAGESPTIRAIEPSRLMLLGGEPLGPRHIWWNFVSSRKERIEQAKADWQAGRIALPPTDNQDVIPLPEDPRPKAEPMS